jgi:PAS domain S-box-containing protein
MDESLYHLIFENTIEFVGLLDTHGTVLLVNRPALEFAGLSNTQVLMRAAWSTPWFIGETGVWLQDAIARAAAGAFIRRDLSLSGVAGQRLDIDFSLRPLPDDQGQVSLIIAEGRDISARLQVERELRESEARHRLVIDTLSEGVVKQRADGTITTCNAAAERILGLSREQMMGRSSLDPRWQAVHEDGSPFPGATHLLRFTRAKRKRTS